jgi:transposase
LEALPCDRCGRAAGRIGTATRTAVDLDLDRPVLLLVTVSVHHCRPCRHYLRAQPPFLRPNAIYTNRVVAKAVQAVYHDGLAMRRVAERLARDFWVRPSEGMVRRWCREYSAGLDFAGDYQPWVVREFSGVLCVDEVYQGRLALLLAVDPAAPDGDRLVGYQLVQGTVDQGAVAAFLTRLREVGVAPAEVITDGSQLYPTVVAAVWPAAAHQLCLFHETRRVTAAVEAVVKAVRATIPRPPPATRRQLGGRRRKTPVAAEAADAATRRWRWREATRAAGIVRVHELRRRGWSLRAIARHTGFNRRTVTAWLRREAPQALPGQPENQPPDAPELEAAAPPAPWGTWDEVRRVRHDLKAGRALLLRRPDHLTQEEQAQVDSLLAGPVGARLRTARHFLEDWFAIWREADGGRPSWDVAHARHARWHTDPAYHGLAPLRRVQGSVDGAQFARLSHFLRQPAWEATSNGAERAGRAFRHGQGPHFNLRSARSIDDLLKARACVQKERTTAAPLRPHGRRTRGRTCRPPCPSPIAA